MRLRESLRDAKARIGIGDFALAKAVGIGERTLRRRLKGQLPTEPELERFQIHLKIPPEIMRRAVMEGDDEYRLKIFRLYREEREKLRPVARAYYSDVALPGYPIITKSDWLPTHPITLGQFDRALQKNELKDEAEGPHPRLAVLGDESYSNFIKRAAPKIRQDDRFCYRLLELRVRENKVTCIFSGSSYSQFINSCDVMGYELAEWYVRNQETPGKRVATNERLRSSCTRSGESCLRF